MGPLVPRSFLTILLPSPGFGSISGSGVVSDGFVYMVVSLTDRQTCRRDLVTESLRSSPPFPSIERSWFFWRLFALM